MVSVAHALTGSFIAHTLPYPWIYIPLAIASHFVLDYIHHYDIGVAMRQHHFSKWQIVFLESLDLLVSAGLIILIWRQSPSHLDLHVWSGAFFGILPDILETTDYFFERPLPILRPLYWLHDRFHHSTTDVFWGSLPQIILVSIIAVVTIFSW